LLLRLGEVKMLFVHISHYTEDKPELSYIACMR